MSGIINADKGNAIRILEYWYLTELLNQESLNTFKEKGKKAAEYKKELATGNRKKANKVVEDFVQFTAGDTLQTVLNLLPKQLKNFHISDFTVFVGCMKKEDCIRKIARDVQWNSESPDAKKANNEGVALAILKFSKDGRYISNSLSISPLAWAMNRLSGGIENSSQKLTIDNFNSDTKIIETQIADLFSPSEKDTVASEDIDTSRGLLSVSYNLLIKAENTIREALNIKEKDMSSYLATYFKLYESENDDENENEVTLHMDFYSKDLEFAIDGLRNNKFTKEKEKTLIDYILGINRYIGRSTKTEHRFDIIKPKNEEELFEFMVENLTVERAPLGKWPSRFMPALMQQVAINIATAPDVNLPIFSVNGPPGTGKTTLLKEIIVNNIVEKAILLAKYDDPDDAFDDYSFSHGEYNEIYKKYHRLKNKKISRYSVLVTSSNNTAVENITKELPVEENLLENIVPSKEANGANEEALAELSKLFTVSKSTEKLPFIQKIWKERINEKGEKQITCERVVEEQPDIYFSRLATELLNAGIKDKEQKKLQALGLISASLGKKENIDKVEKKVIAPFLDIIGTNKDIEPRKESYLEMRKIFLTQLKLVMNLRKELDRLCVEEKAVAETHKKVEEKERQIEMWREIQRSPMLEADVAEQKLQEKVIQLNSEKENFVTEITKIRASCETLDANIKAKNHNIATILENIEVLQNSVSIFGKLFKSKKYKETQKSITQERSVQIQCQQEVDVLNAKLGEEKRKEDSFQAKVNTLTAEISDVKKALEKLYLKRENVKAKEKRLESELAAVQKKETDQKKLLEIEKEKYHNQDSYERGFVLNRQFISDILSDDKRISTKAQIRNPWFSEHYNREREKLFLYALQLTKKFILSSKKCRNNFQHLYCLWSGNYYSNKKNKKVKFIGNDLQNCTAAAYETFFILIPVISSTFASVQRFLKNVKEEDIIGTLIVDEAGQASPHMAIGALCRSRKAIIVGDPKQVEPVVTDDQDLLKKIYTDDFFNPYKDKTNSVQRFADSINPYGTYLKNAQGVEEWVGCPLLVHRRCISPMYEISNDISYNNIMKQQTAQPNAEKEKLFIATKSQWFNVRGKEEGIKRHFVKEQGEKVIKMLEIAFSKTSTPDVFIISPFETVESGIKDYLKKYIRNCKQDGSQSFLVKHEDSFYAWLSRNVGTVHKFQGREASEVIFLLGCDTSEEAKPAIRWVKSNIVNVAATRAKYRFYAIGDIEAWKKSRYVNRAKKILDSFTSGSLGWVPQNYDPNGGYTLVVTEKPSVAETYAKALCVWNEPTNEFYEGNGYLITWCLGHLFELVTPEKYDVKYKKWNINDLPIIPDNWKYQIIGSKNPDEKKINTRRFNALKTLMNRDDVTSILCATDAGREGELIFRLVYQQTECKKPVKRIWLSSMEPDSIRKTFENPIPESNYDLLYEAAKCRSWADWIVGMNATRFYTCNYENEATKTRKKVLNVGRVVSPTLAMVVNREKEIETFAPETYYTVNLKIGGIIFESRHFENRDEAIEVKQKCCRNIFTELSEEINYMRKTIGYALASKWLVENNMKVRFMYREEPDDASDSGWRFFSGDESDEYVNNPENIGLYSIETISQIDPDIIPLLSNDVGTAFERESGNEPFRESL